MKYGYNLGECSGCSFVHQKEIRFFLNKIFNNTCFSQKSYIWGKTDYKNKYQCFRSAPRIFAHLQVLHTFLHVFSDAETTEAETKCKPAMLAISCQTTQDIVLETAKKPSFTLLAYLTICCVCLESTKFLLLKFLRVLVSILWCPIELKCNCVFVYAVTDVFLCLWDDHINRNGAFCSLSLLSFLSRYFLCAQIALTMSVQECFCYSLDC